MKSSPSLQHVLSRAPMFVALGLVALCAACAASPPPSFGFAPTEPVAPVPETIPDGTIYRTSASLQWGLDPKASQPGDILTISLRESTSASKKANVVTSKDSSIDFAAPVMAGGPVTRNGKEIMEFSVDGQRGFAGDGQSSQSNQMNGRITVTVAQVMANGNLLVRGEKWITLNQGDEYIQFSGLVRPADITPGNTIYSDQVANARIIYSGKGPIADASKMGWLSRFFNSGLMPY